MIFLVGWYLYSLFFFGCAHGQGKVPSSICLQDTYFVFLAANKTCFGYDAVIATPWTVSEAFFIREGIAASLPSHNIWIGIERHAGDRYQLEQSMHRHRHRHRLLTWSKRPPCKVTCYSL